MIRVSMFSLLVLSCSFISPGLYSQSFNEMNKVVKSISGNIRLGVTEFEGTNPLKHSVKQKH